MWQHTGTYGVVDNLYEFCGKFHKLYSSEDMLRFGQVTAS